MPSVDKPAYIRTARLGLVSFLVIAIISLGVLFYGSMTQQSKVAELQHDVNTLRQENARLEAMAATPYREQAEGLKATVDNLQAELQAEQLETQRLQEELQLALGDSESGVAALATVGDRPDVDLSIDYGGLEATAFERGDQDQAGEYYASLLEEAKRSGYRAGEVAAYHNLAVVARLLGNTEEAEVYASSALETAKQIEGAQAAMISIYSGLQVTSQVESNLEQASQSSWVWRWPTKTWQLCTMGCKSTIWLKNNVKKFVKS